MRTLIDIEQELTTCTQMLPNATKEARRALEKRIEQLEWERLVEMNK